MKLYRITPDLRAKLGDLKDNDIEPFPSQSRTRGLVDPHRVYDSWERKIKRFRKAVRECGFFTFGPNGVLYITDDRNHSDFGGARAILYGTSYIETELADAVTRGQI